MPQKVKAYLLETIASDPGLQQTELVFLGLFGRACRVLETANPQVRRCATTDGGAHAHMHALAAGPPLTLWLS